jgi:diguanylate cyclase (GGDEF)-like protein/PAS domain S-box-containing protein
MFRFPGGAAFRLLRAVLVGMTVLFALAAGYMSFLIFERQETLSKVSRYDAAWSAAQGVNEFTRLLQRVTALIMDAPDKPSMEEVVLRFEIFKGRLKLFETGEFSDFIDRESEYRQTLDRLSEMVAQLEPLMSGIDQPENAKAALRLMMPAESELIGLASGANQFSGANVTAFETELLELHRMFSVIALGFFLFGSLFIGLLGWHNNLLTRIYTRLRAANKGLQRATARLSDANAAVQQVNRELVTQNQRFDAALNNMARGLCMFDAQRRLIVSNARFAQIYGIAPERLKPGITFDELFTRLMNEEVSTPDSSAAVLAEHLGLVEHAKVGTLLHQLKDGRIISISHQPMENGGWVATYDDITERRHAEERIAHMARHDPLTGLPNRLMLREHVEGVLESETPRVRAVAMMCLDLDNFKNVNDTLGHPVGDALLRQVAHRIVPLVDRNGLVARFGGDEFVIVLHDIGAEDVSSLAQSLVEAISRPYQLDGHHIIASASIGIALASGRGVGMDDLLKNADLALYRAKGDGRGRYCLFHPEMDSEVQRRRVLELRLRTCDFDEDFELLFQPLVDLQARKVTAVEALLRWTGAFEGKVTPDEFIPIAEDSGVIVPLGQWVLEKACALAMQLPPDVQVAVNLSPFQFRHGGVVETVEKALSKTGLAADRLELEITETVLLDDSEEVLSTLNQLRALGARISLDDFGTGYSSLAYLRKFSVDKVKIDRSFVKDIEENEDHLAIVQAIIGLTHVLGMTSVAEGVETDEQLRLIQESGCQEAQGNLLSPPISSAAIKEWLAKRRWKPRIAAASDTSSGTG